MTDSLKRYCLLALNVKSSLISFQEWDLFQNRKIKITSARFKTALCARNRVLWHVDRVMWMNVYHTPLSICHCFTLFLPFLCGVYTYNIIVIEVDVLVYSFIRMNDFKIHLLDFHVHCTQWVDFFRITYNIRFIYSFDRVYWFKKYNEWLNFRSIISKNKISKDKYQK